MKARCAVGDFTRGPWRFNPGESNISHTNVIRDRSIGAVDQDYGAGYHIADVWRDGELMKEAEANARLIAAAPELYEALKAALISVELDASEVNNQEPLIAQIKAAIQKAEGAQ